MPVVVPERRSHPEASEFVTTLKGSVAFVRAFVLRFFLRRTDRRQKMDQLFLNSFNASYPGWVKKGWVKRPR